MLDRLPTKTYLNLDTMVLLRADDPRLRPPAAARSLHVLDDDHTRVYNGVDLTGHMVYSMGSWTLSWQTVHSTDTIVKAPPDNEYDSFEFCVAGSSLRN